MFLVINSMTVYFCPNMLLLLQLMHILTVIQNVLLAHRQRKRSFVTNADVEICSARPGVTRAKTSRQVCTESKKLAVRHRVQCSAQLMCLQLPMDAQLRAGARRDVDVEFLGLKLLLTEHTCWNMPSCRCGEATVGLLGDEIWWKQDLRLFFGCDRMDATEYIHQPRYPGS